MLSCMFFAPIVVLVARLGEALPKAVTDTNTSEWGTD